MTNLESTARLVMDARDQILDRVGPDAAGIARSVLAGTQSEALLNPEAVDLIVNYSLKEAARLSKERNP